SAHRRGHRRGPGLGRESSAARLHRRNAHQMHRSGGDPQGPSAHEVAPASGSDKRWWGEATDEPAREDACSTEKCQRTTTRRPAGPWRKRFQMPPRCRSRRRKEADSFYSWAIPPRHLGGYKADAAGMPRNWHAKMRALRATVSRVHSLAPCLRSRSAISETSTPGWTGMGCWLGFRWGNGCLVKSSGVLLPLSFALISAPWAMRSSRMSLLALQTAWCSAVRPYLSAAFTSAPFLSSNSVNSLLRASTAKDNGVRPSPFLAFTSALRASSNSVIW